MLTLLLRWTLGVIGTLALVGLICRLDAGAQEDSKKAGPQGDKGEAKEPGGAQPKLTRVFLPAKHFCGGQDGCHGKDKPSKDPEIVCNLTEYSTYAEYDKHGNAMAVLKGKTGQDM